MVHGKPLDVFKEMSRYLIDDSRLLLTTRQNVTVTEEIKMIICASEIIFV